MSGILTKLFSKACTGHSATWDCLDKDAGITSIKVFASNGGLVYSREIEGKDSHQVNMEAYESGTYILKLKSRQGSYSQKIVKE